MIHQGIRVHSCCAEVYHSRNVRLHRPRAPDATGEIHKKCDPFRRRGASTFSILPGDAMANDPRGFFGAMIGDGRPLVSFSGICLGLAGLFAIFQSMTGHFLPHDVEFLQMQPEELCSFNECRIVHFMIHDRISFGGSLIAISVLYLWFAEFPLRHREEWAWWTLLASGFIGFGSFLTYLGYGYLDTWHGTATMALLPCFGYGLWLQRPLMVLPRRQDLWHRFLRQSVPIRISSRDGFGRCCLILSACGMIGGGLTIQWIGMTSVFVTTDLEFMGISRQELHNINTRLIPLIAHDRAGFGGAVTTVGLMTLLTVWFASPSRSLWQALMTGGLAGWSTAVFVHPAIGYTDLLHLAPAVLGAVLFMVGLILTRRTMSAAVQY